MSTYRSAKSAPYVAKGLAGKLGALAAGAKKGFAGLLAKASALPLPVKIAIVVVTLAVAAYFVFFTPGLLKRGGKGKKASPVKGPRASSRVAKAEPKAKSPSPKKKAASPGPAKRSASKSKKSKK